MTDNQKSAPDDTEERHRAWLCSLLFNRDLSPGQNPSPVPPADWSGAVDYLNLVVVESSNLHLGRVTIERHEQQLPADLCHPSCADAQVQVRFVTTIHASRTERADLLTSLHNVASLHQSIVRQMAVDRRRVLSIRQLMLDDNDVSPLQLNAVPFSFAEARGDAALPSAFPLPLPHSALQFALRQPHKTRRHRIHGFADTVETNIRTR